MKPPQLHTHTHTHTHTYIHTYIHTLEQVPGALSAADTAPLRELALARIRDIEAGLKKEGVDIGCGTNGKERPCTMVFMNCFITTTAVVAALARCVRVHSPVQFSPPAGVGVGTGPKPTSYISVLTALFEFELRGLVLTKVLTHACFLCYRLYRIINLFHLLPPR